MKTAVITGARGFLGRHLVKTLQHEGTDVIAVDRGPRPPWLLPEHAYLQVDVAREGALLAGLESHRFDRPSSALLHLAALSNVAECEADYDECARVNVEGTRATLAAANVLGIPRFVFASTATVYGDDGSRPFVETDPRRPANLYAKSKADAEEVLAAPGRGSPSCLIARFSNVYGADSSPESMPGRVFAQVMKGGPISLRDLAPVRDFLYVEDAVLALLHLGAATPHPSRAFNVGSGESHSVREFAEAAARVGGLNVPIQQTRPDQRASAVRLNVERARREIGWRSRWSFVDGIGDSIRRLKKGEA